MWQNQNHTRKSALLLVVPLAAGLFAATGLAATPADAASQNRPIPSADGVATTVPGPVSTNANTKGGPAAQILKKIQPYERVHTAMIEVDKYQPESAGQIKPRLVVTFRDANGDPVKGVRAFFHTTDGQNVKAKSNGRGVAKSPMPILGGKGIVTGKVYYGIDNDPAHEAYPFPIEINLDYWYGNR